MNNLKKINIVFIMIILIVCMFTNKAFATLNGNVNLTKSKDNVTYGEQFSIYVSISDLQTTKGIIAIGAILSYDTDSLTLVDIKGENNWSDPFYKESNGKLTSVKNKLSTSNESVFKIIFEVNEKGKAESSAWIKINNFEISDGDEENNCGGNSINIAIVELDNEDSGSDNQGGNNQGSNSEDANQGGNNQGSNSGNTNQGGSNQGSNSGNNQSNKPSTGTITKPSANISTNNQGEDLNDGDIPNDNNNEDTNIIENSTDVENVNKDNNIQNTLENNIEQKDNKKIVYIISIIGIITIIVILFLTRKVWKTN